MQAGQCGNQMSTKFWELVCDGHGIGGDGEYCGDNDAHLGRINVFYHETSGGKYVPRAVFFDLEPGVIGAEQASPLGELLCPENFVKVNAGARAATWPRPTTQRLGTNSAESPL
jgi:tubulin beta